MGGFGSRLWVACSVLPSHRCARERPHSLVVVTCERLRVTSADGRQVDGLLSAHVVGLNVELNVLLLSEGAESLQKKNGEVGVEKRKKLIIMKYASRARLNKKKLIKDHPE